MCSILDSSPHVYQTTRTEHHEVAKKLLSRLLTRTVQAQLNIAYESVSPNVSGIDCGIHTILSAFRISQHQDTRLSAEEVSSARKCLLWLFLWDLWISQALTPFVDVELAVNILPQRVQPAVVIAQPTIRPLQQPHACRRPATVQQLIICPKESQVKPLPSSETKKLNGSTRPAIGPTRPSLTEEVNSRGPISKIYGRDQAGAYLIELSNGLRCSIYRNSLQGYPSEMAISVHYTGPELQQNRPTNRLIGRDERGNYMITLGRGSHCCVDRSL